VKIATAEHAEDTERSGTLQRPLCDLCGLCGETRFLRALRFKISPDEGKVRTS